MAQPLPAIDLMDTFLGNGGYIIQLDNPTSEQISPYIDFFTNQKLTNTDSNFISYCNAALYGLNKSIQNEYPNPHLILTFTSDNVCCGLIFFYEVSIKTPPFVWSEIVTATKVAGALELLEWSMGNNAGQLGYGIGASTSEGPIGSRFNAESIKDAETKWTIIPIEQIKQIVLEQKDYSMSKPNFSKVFEQSLVWAEKGTN